MPNILKAHSLTFPRSPNVHLKARIWESCGIGMSCPVMRVIPRMMDSNFFYHMCRASVWPVTIVSDIVPGLVLAMNPKSIQLHINSTVSSLSSKSHNICFDARQYIFGIFSFQLLLFISLIYVQLVFYQILHHNNLIYVHHHMDHLLYRINSILGYCHCNCHYYIHI